MSDENTKQNNETVEETSQPKDLKEMTPEERAREILKDGEDMIYANLKEYDHDFLHVYMNEPFLAGISIEISKRPNNKIETAAVCINPDSNDIELIYNQKFFKEMTQTERRGVIRHELYHVVFQHLTDRLPADREQAMIWNIATDMAINSIIGKENLPDLAIIPGKPIPPRKDMSSLDKSFNEWVKNAPPYQASEWYFEGVKNLIEKDKKEGGDGQFGSGFADIMMDDHSMWGKLPQNVRDMLKDKIKNMVERAANTADQKNQWGNIPAEIQERIRKMVSKEVDWKSVIRNFIGRCRSQDRESTLKRINKKMPYIFPGIKRTYTANFACFIDQSGSVGDEDLCIFFGELENLANLTKLDVYFFDTEIDEKNHFTWEKGKKIEPKRTRCGGTDFDAVSKFLNRKDNRGKWSGAFILTDGYAPKMSQVIGTKILWVITPSGDATAARPGDYVVQMKKEKKFQKA